MLTGLSTAAGPMTHIGASSGACLIAGFVRTSTGQGTRGCGNPGRPGPPANRPGSPTRRFGRSSDRNVRQAGSRLQSSTVFGSTADRRTGSGSTDDADAMPWDAEDQERDRIQPTALSGSPETTPTPRSRPERPSPTRTWRGDEADGSARTLRPLAQLGFRYLKSKRHSQSARRLSGLRPPQVGESKSCL